ncbi:zinc-binding metallopeptidase family protein [Listeria fleischmannii]|nr:peptidase [Listeria fleischmannii]MBC1399777.1 endo-1,4-beta-glucanase [Listeria fleischmannii]MBC1428069.1 endo-1,4-beta-glucanase [Listeria fleischmannii]STY36071.1 Putative aminopeptidase ysdC [Listeria fleischmannii subsp. coloradonensis]
MKKDLLKQLVTASSVSGDEEEVRQILKEELAGVADEISYDGLGSFIARKGSSGPKIALVSHMDEVGFIVKHISQEGFIYFDTVGSFWSQSLLNHRVQIRTEDGSKVLGVIGSVAPHALSESEKQKPADIAQMFIDIGADSYEAVLKKGVNIGDFITPEANFAALSDDRILGKALDNRAGCALMVELFKAFENTDATLYGVSTVQEEVGLRGAQTSVQKIEPDIAIILDTLVAGDTPNINAIHFPLKLGGGAGIPLFDKRYLAHKKLTRAFKTLAEKLEVPLQFCTLKTGATDGGRYNVMASGRPVIAFTLPTRYLHANSSMISIYDYDVTKELVATFINTYNTSTHEKISQF